MLVHVAEALPAPRQRQFLIEVKGVLHLPGRVVLRLEKGVEIPERALDDPAVHLGKSHLEEDLAHLVDESLVRV